MHFFNVFCLSGILFAFLHKWSEEYLFYGKQGGNFKILVLFYGEGGDGFGSFLERSSWFLADLEYSLLHLEQFHKRWQLVFPGTIPSSFAGLSELPDQYALELHREALNAGHTRNDLSPLLERVPQRNPLFFRADFPKCFPPFCKNVPPESFTYRFARVHRSPPGPLCKGCPTASRMLVPCRVSRPGS